MRAQIKMDSATDSLFLSLAKRSFILDEKPSQPLVVAVVVVVDPQQNPCPKLLLLIITRNDSANSNTDIQTQKAIIDGEEWAKVRVYIFSHGID